MFTDEELEAVVLGLRLTAEHGDEALGRAAVEVVAKLRAVLPRDLKALVDETALLAGPSRGRPPEQIDLAEVRRAIREQRKARLAYADRRGAQHRAGGVAPRPGVLRAVPGGGGLVRGARRLPLVPGRPDRDVDDCPRSGSAGRARRSWPSGGRARDPAQLPG